jgi:hypothetical protein
VIFSLEALHAKQGDSLLLRFGEAGKERLIVIDGGPARVFDETLEPRLEALRAAAGGTLPIELLMISHIDEDHINGILDFSEALIEAPQRRSEYPVLAFWHNSFEDLIEDGGEVIELVDAALAPAGFGVEVASVTEGRRLRKNARELRWEENAGFDGFVMAPDDGGVEVDLDLDPLRLTVVAPRRTEIERLRKTWKQELEKLKEEGKLKVADISDPDPSPTNLSSIVCVAELEGKRMLLTGDARGDEVKECLEAAGFLPKGEGPMKLDLLKVPHHGSSRNVDVDFFKRLPARHLVISANGLHHNPDIATLKMISEARRDDDFTLYLTESKFKEGMGPKIERFLAKERKEGRSYEVVFCPPEEPGIRVDLLDEPA